MLSDTLARNEDRERESGKKSVHESEGCMLRCKYISQ